MAITAKVKRGPGRSLLESVTYSPGKIWTTLDFKVEPLPEAFGPDLRGCIRLCGYLESVSPKDVAGEEYDILFRVENVYRGDYPDRSAAVTLIAPRLVKIHYKIGGSGKGFVSVPDVRDIISSLLEKLGEMREMPEAKGNAVKSALAAVSDAICLTEILVTGNKEIPLQKLQEVAVAIVQNATNAALLAAIPTGQGKE